MMGQKARIVFKDVILAPTGHKNTFNWLYKERPCTYFPVECTMDQSLRLVEAVQRMISAINGAAHKHARVNAICTETVPKRNGMISNLVQIAFLRLTVFLRLTFAVRLWTAGISSLPTVLKNRHAGGVELILTTVMWLQGGVANREN